MMFTDEEALALTLGARHDVAVWSQDKDFSVSGLEVVTTGDLLDVLAGGV